MKEHSENNWVAFFYFFTDFGLIFLFWYYVSFDIICFVWKYFIRILIKYIWGFLFFVSFIVLSFFNFIDFNKIQLLAIRNKLVYIDRTLYNIKFYTFFPRLKIYFLYSNTLHSI